MVESNEQTLSPPFIINLPHTRLSTQFKLQPAPSADTMKAQIPLALLAWALSATAHCMPKSIPMLHAR